jgi:hypothetical protein
VPLIDRRHALALSIVAVAAAPVINSLWLSALGVDYFDLYLEDGFGVVLLFGVLTFAIDLDKYPDLIAAHPIVYLASTSQLVGTVFLALPALLEGPLPEDKLRDAGLDFLAPRFRLRVLDEVLTVLALMVLLVAALAWLVLVAPLQYWVNLVCGAPAREALASSKTLWLVKRSDGNVQLGLDSKDPDEFAAPEMKVARAKGETMSEVTFTSRPVTFTAAIAAAALFGVSLLV